MSIFNTAKSCFCYSDIRLHSFFWTKSNQLLIQKKNVHYLPSTEAEYKSIPNALKENTLVRNIPHELHVTISMTPTIYCHNFWVAYLSHNPCLIPIWNMLLILHMNMTRFKIIEFMLLIFMLVINLLSHSQSHCLYQQLLGVFPS